MKNSMALLICMTFIFSFSHGLFCQEVNEMHVKIVSNNLIVANKGKNQGVQINSVYNISRDEQLIGKAKVLMIEEDVSGLKIIELTPGFSVENGDVLIINTGESKRQEDKGYIYQSLPVHYCINLKTDKIIQITNHPQPV